MKKSFLPFLLLMALMLGTTSYSFALSNAEQFSIDETALTDVFAPLQQLEEIVINNPEADVNFVQVNYSRVLNAVNLFDAASSLAHPLEDRPVAGITGYIWGACLGLAGIAIVYFLLDDASTSFRKTETTHAVIGCAISTAVWTVLYFAVLATALGGV